MSYKVEIDSKTGNLLVMESGFSSDSYPDFMLNEPDKLLFELDDKAKVVFKHWLCFGGEDKNDPRTT